MCHNVGDRLLTGSDVGNCALTSAFRGHGALTGSNFGNGGHMLEPPGMDVPVLAGYKSVGCDGVVAGVGLDIGACAVVSRLLSLLWGGGA